MSRDPVKDRTAGQFDKCHLYITSLLKIITCTLQRGPVHHVSKKISTAFEHNKNLSLFVKGIQIKPSA